MSQHTWEPAHWKGRWRWWALKNPRNLLNEGLLTRNLVVPLNPNRRGLLHMNLRTMLHLNLRTTRNLLLSCSHLPSNFLSSDSRSLLGILHSCLLSNLLDCLMSSLPSRILHHLLQGILIDWWNRLRRNRGRHMLIPILSGSSGGLSTNNSPLWRNLKGNGERLTSAETEYKYCKKFY